MGRRYEFFTNLTNWELSNVFDELTLASRVLIMRSTDDPLYRADRQGLDRKLAKILFIHNNLGTNMRDVDRVLGALCDKPMDLVDFLLLVLLELASHTHGLRDLHQTSLRDVVTRSEQHWSDFRRTLTVIDYLGESK
ncbi:MAG TPA: hypothetical protein PK156_25740 [Polyangium sp.]|nr:hypothetical protein [Polyangium sp.]